MTLTPTNRMAIQETRGRGRPRDAEERQDPAEAVTVVLNDAVLPCICPKCGRGMTPRVLRRRTDGVRDCACGLCGAGLEYTPASIRPK